MTDNLQDAEERIEQKEEKKKEVDWEEKVKAMEAAINFQQAFTKLLLKNGCDKRATLIQFCNIMRSLGIEFDLKQMFEDDRRERKRIEKEVDEVLAAIDEENETKAKKEKVRGKEKGEKEKEDQPGTH